MNRSVKSEGDEKMKTVHRVEEVISDQGSFENNTRLNLNDLLKRKKEENLKTRKKNIYIFSGASAVAAVILIILSL